ncbi:TPA: hypothetical protein WI150_000381 [Neisseria meningitidis]|uniref:hypothetical protein n=1 Tax=Neisseria meningitidis TaxID=487 RepID=UPI000308D73D|nr:hypothetical protein [Neisseria meningitidis]MBJ1799351.1 hypothetical protein [Neisseria meningitidis]MBJ1822322.1 hypothetical protein [Neisseria meningitidis]MBJ1826042.1 hypothetical protein [Neisseria meningitidis]MBJ1828491.1 hypothetical protein [Neisseria meningitidis]MBJ1830284.1 hypothetical protein [Neisseria meningitidis]
MLIHYKQIVQGSPFNQIWVSIFGSFGHLAISTFLPPLPVKMPSEISARYFRRHTRPFSRIPGSGLKFKRVRK